MANLYNPSGIGQLDADDWNAYQTQKRQALLARDLGKSQNAYRRTQASLDWTRGKRDLGFNYGIQRRQFGSDLNQRGLLNSGIYRQQYMDLLTARQYQDADLKQQHDRTLEGLRQADGQLDLIYKHAIDDTDSAEAARRASVAAALAEARRNG